MDSNYKKDRKKVKVSVYHYFNWKIAITIFLVLFIAGALVPPFIIWNVFLIFKGDLPSPEELENYTPPLITTIYSDDGEVLEKFAGQQRIWVPLEKMSPYLIDALLASEDQNYYRHWGVDIWGITRAMMENIRARTIVQGGSTITQQLARTLFLSRKQTYMRKVKEALTAIKLERKYSKQEILELYLNQNYMGKGAHGVQAAALSYFGKDIDSLNIEEAALLAGVLKAPYRYSPANNPELGLKRRNIVIESMRREGKISREVADSIKQIPIKMVTSQTVVGKAPYFTEFIRQYLANKYGDQFVYQSGVSVYTTLDWSLQEKADSIFSQRIAILQRWIEKIHHDDDPDFTEMILDTVTGESIRVYKKLQGAMLATEPGTGYIKVMIGGRDFQESEFNRAVQAIRQPGSAFKPFVYTAAIDNGYRPIDKIDDTPLVLEMEDGKVWRPHNYDNTYKGPTTLRDALKQSRNLVAIKLIQKVTPKQVIYYARRMGIRTQMSPYPSLAIGSCGVTMLDLVTAYSVFPNGGVRVDPVWITRIVDRHGKVIEENKPNRSEVLSAATAYVMTDMLQSVIDAGTGVSARYAGFDRPCGGKTGTTNDYTDAWFIGFTKQLCCAVRVGFDDMTSIGQDQTGAKTALPIWVGFMLEAHKDYVYREFDIPPNVVYATVCKESGLLSTTRCPDTIKEIFVKGTEPTSYCNLSHRRETTPTRRIEPEKPQKTAEDDQDPSIFKEKKKESERKIRF
ncbi:PBP1A family penicillin-binding protein [bacterium]|nr:PBP1A family penicillin-binding protein [bacterium]